MTISVQTVARWTALILTLVIATLFFGVALVIVLFGLEAGRYYEAMGAGLLFSLAGGLPPLLAAVMLTFNARRLKRGVAGRWAKGVALAAALIMGVCAFWTATRNVGDVFVALFFLTAILLASPLALRSPRAPEPPKS